MICYPSKIEETEEWRAVEGIPLEVSNIGRVRNLDGKMRKPTCNKYFRINIYPKGQTVSGFLVHRLVAAAFLGPCPDGKEVNHKDGNKTNNRVENLEYVSRSRNRRHAVELGLSKSVPIIPIVNPSGRRPTGKAFKLTENKVKEIRESYASGELQSNLARRFGVTKACIKRVVRLETWRWMKDLEAGKVGVSG